MKLTDHDKCTVWFAENYFFALRCIPWFDRAIERGDITTEDVRLSAEVRITTENQSGVKYIDHVIFVKLPELKGTRPWLGIVCETKSRREQKTLGETIRQIQEYRSLLYLPRNRERYGIDFRQDGWAILCADCYGTKYDRALENIGIFVCHPKLQILRSTLTLRKKS